MHRRSYLALSLVLALVGCSKSEPTASRVPAPVVAPPQTATVATPPTPPTDPEGVPDHGPSTLCSAATGDARAMRTRLRAIERGRVLVPESVASLTEGCGATAVDIATSLEKAGRAIGRAHEHDYAAAAAYYRRALEVDPSYVSARLSLAGARAHLGQFDAALYQLEQIRASGTDGRRTFAKVYSDPGIAPLRMRPAFWTFIGDRPNSMVRTLAEATESPLDPVGVDLDFDEPLEIPSEVIYTSISLHGTQYRSLAAAVNAATGGHLVRPTSVSRDLLTDAWIENIGSLGSASLLTRPAAFRFGGGNVVLALPFLAGEVGEQLPVVLIAAGPDAGPYQVLKVIESSSSCETPLMFTSSDRRVLGFFTECSSGDSPASFGRCLIDGEGGRMVVRCGNGATSAGGVVAADSEDYDEEDYGDDEEYYGDD